MKQIIKTENPDIIIERSFIDKEISIDELNKQIYFNNHIINELNGKLNDLKSTQINSVILKDIVEKEILELTHSIEYHQNLINQYNDILKNINE